MAPLTQLGDGWGPRQRAGALAAFGAALAWVAAGAVGAVMLVVFAAALVAAVMVAGGALLVAAIALAIRHSVQREADDHDLIEAEHVGGHSWVAYGWRDRP